MMPDIAVVPGDPHVDEFVDKVTLLRRGWTHDLIGQFLPRPDRLVVDPATGRRASRWSVRRAARIEATSKWQHAAAPAGRVPAPRRPADDQLVAAALAEVDDILIVVPHLPWDVLVEASVKAHRRHHRLPPMEPLAEKIAEIDPAVVRRWVVNFLRHDCTAYERHIRWANQQPGHLLVVAAFRRRIYQAIADMYPQLADECATQLKERTPS